MKLTEEELKEQLELYAEKNDELRARNQELERQLENAGKMMVAEHDDSDELKIKYCPMCGRRLGDD